MSTRSDLARGEATTRSYLLCVSAGFSYDDFTDAVGLPFCTLPIGAIVLSGLLRITTAFNSTTSDTLIVGDASDPNEYLSALDAQAIADTPFTLSNVFDISAGSITPAIVAASDEITITVTAGTADTATAGVGDLHMFYIDPTKADENYE